jgi:chromosomal replication initiation ATPase DnaA
VQGQHVQLWTNVQALLEQRMPRAEFDTWIKATYLAALDEHQAFIGTPNIFARDKVQTIYRAAIADALYRITGRLCSVEVVMG